VIRQYLPDYPVIYDETSRDLCLFETNNCLKRWHLNCLLNKNKLIDMRKLLLITLVTLIISITTFAQDKGNEKTNTQVNKEDTRQNDNNLLPDKEKFIDLNGNGINDYEEQKGKQKGKKRDKFIDKDGDGINDNRCQGLSWGNSGKKNQYGKRGR
jgi:hypothetical protein